MKCEEIKLPELVELCGVCRGYGAYRQHFLEGVFTSECDACKGAQFIYSSGCQPVPKSVREQIKNANGLVERIGKLAHGPFLWPASSIEIDDWSITPSGACYEIKSRWPAKPVVEKSK